MATSANNSVYVLTSIVMAKLESVVVWLFNLPFYYQYGNECFSKKKRDKPIDLLEPLNSYHPNIVFTGEENPNFHLWQQTGLQSRQEARQSSYTLEVWNSHKMEKELYHWRPPQSETTFKTTYSKQLKERF